MSTADVPEREEVDEQYKWDLDSLFASDDEWEAAFEAVEERLDDLETYEGRVTEDADTLAALLETREEIMRQVADVSAYARMRSDEDTADQHYQALSARAQSLSADASSAASFIEPELQQSTREELQALVAENPDLERYEHYFDDVLRMKPHTRSAEVEELLADLSEVTGAGGEVYNMLTNADMEFPPVEEPDGGEASDASRPSTDSSGGGEASDASRPSTDSSDGGEVRPTLSNFTTLLKRRDRDFRRRVHETFYEEWAGLRNAVGTAYKNSVKADIKLARVRNYETAREASLDDANIPVSVYDNLVETVEDNIDVLHRHADLKRDVLGVDELRSWDLYTPLAEGEVDLPYEEAREHVVEAVAPLGGDYQSRVAEGLDSRWVDVYETANKRSGAYSGGTYDSQPYVLMNYQDDITSMYTLAHELGHSLHSELTSETQPHVYSGYEIFVAEVASTVNEALLTEHLLETVDDERFRRHVLDEYLERFRSTLFRQTMFADFEHRTHQLAEEGEAITPDVCDDIYGDLKSTYYEPMAMDDGIRREWMRIPHFYYSFYVYQYATGISAANALVDRILEEGKPAAADYREFLSKGSREYPLELLRGAGVDMAAPDPVEQAIDTYDDLVAEFESLT